ncbi:MAG TPA: UDP-N-acetylglucosamine 2-epimerase (non-hydrolyzing) [Candidatus Polarisedimenticolia bacterium]|nr:UDP-N-acetylglucosamine 2-epimerase (non-hydrolyzing) [Candidatus Polarisedimenticolia bacterium]
MKARRRQRLLLVAGARPNFMKVAPLLRALRRRPDRFEPLLVHTGQHYDEAMSDVFFDELGIPPPDRHLGVGSGSHAVQTARIMEAFEPVVAETKPDRVVVVGDVNSTAACALVATKMSPPIPVAHVEAGLRSFDREMPEEINRLVTDALSDLLFTTSPDADANLRSEGVPRRRIHRVGNLMIDTLKAFAARSEGSPVLSRLRLEPPYALLTLHRPSNVDDEGTLRRILAALRQIGQRLPVLFPAHPRTADRLRRLALAEGRPGAAGEAGGAGEVGGAGEWSGDQGLRIVEPLGYLDFLKLQKHAALVLTDSGGILEETTILGVPCLTLRENTERPITLTRGTNRLVGTDTGRIVREARRALAGRRRKAPAIPLWDGRTADRIAAVLARHGGASIDR